VVSFFKGRFNFVTDRVGDGFVKKHVPRHRWVGDALGGRAPAGPVEQAARTQVEGGAFRYEPPRHRVAPSGPRHGCQLDPAKGDAKTPGVGVVGISVRRSDSVGRAESDRHVTG
jgi:hypothetical protein